MQNTSFMIYHLDSVPQYVHFVYIIKYIYIYKINGQDIII